MTQPPESSANSSQLNNSLEETHRMRTNKRKASTTQDSARKRQRVPTEPTKAEVQAVTTEGTERKTRPEVEVPNKKQRNHSNNSYISEVVDETVKGSKRKATTQTDTPSDKHRGGNINTGESVRRVNEAGSKKEAIAEQLPVTQTPRTTRTDRGCDVSPSSSGPSASRQHNGSSSFLGKTCRADFEAKYLQCNKLGEGGFGSVYAGIRRRDNLPVAIKHIPQAGVERQSTLLNGMNYMIPTEVLLLLKVAGPESVGKSAAVSLLDWYDLEQEVLLVMERPVPAVDLLNYLYNNNGPLEEDTAKIIMKQLVEAAIKLHSEGVFHRDIKAENILIQTTSDGLRVRVIDFGCGCILRTRFFHSFAGTFAYAPPEYFTCRTYEAGPTTVWQLGTLLYEMMDGYKQFITSTFLCKGVKCNKTISQNCWDLLNRCLTVNLKDRVTLEQMLVHPWFT